jgi:hypothetical protein
MLPIRVHLKLFAASMALFYVLWLLHDHSKAFAPEMWRTTFLGASMIFVLLRLMTLLVARLAKG